MGADPSKIDGTAWSAQLGCETAQVPSYHDLLNPEGTKTSIAGSLLGGPSERHAVVVDGVVFRPTAAR